MGRKVTFSLLNDTASLQAFFAKLYTRCAVKVYLTSHMDAKSLLSSTNPFPPIRWDIFIIPQGILVSCLYSDSYNTDYLLPVKPHNQHPGVLTIRHIPPLLAGCINWTTDSSEFSPSTRGLAVPKSINSCSLYPGGNGARADSGEDSRRAGGGERAGAYWRSPPGND